jgi:(R,R)-butanediol dehydrogenase/meso-butanediol dehydrogenase/diacetyl reductase
MTGPGTTMRAVRLHGREDLRVEELPVPQVEPGTVLLRDGFNGICGSDLHLFFTPESLGFDLHRPAELTGAMLPQILGHEFSGVVAEVGEGVDDVRPGDRVAVFPLHYCRRCAACRRGRYNECRRMALEGIQGRSGGMAQVKLIAADQLHVLPDTVGLQHGALVEPLAVAWHAAAVSGLQPGGTALVVGGGPIGLGVWFALRARGARTVIVSEPSPERRTILSRLGVDVVVDPRHEDLVRTVMDVTAGRGVDVTLDAAGQPGAFPDAMRSLGLEGRMVIVASYEEPVPLQPTLLLGGKQIVTSATYTHDDFTQVISALAQSDLPLAGWVETIGFDDVAGALHRLRAGHGMKLLVRTP